MQAALFLARTNQGRTRPNPSVGAIVADPVSGEIISSAVTAPGGRPHAEALALEKAGPRARGAVLFTTLEPCSHHGNTPPCADAIVTAGISAVFYGSLDPDPRVSGRGFARLQTNGVAVYPSPIANEADWHNLGHALRMTERRPFIQLKLAVDGANKVPIGAAGRPTWVTSADTRAQAHLLRSQADAILAGRGTIIADDPELTCRLPGMESRSPIRIVLSASGSLPSERRLFKDAFPPVWIFTSESRMASPHELPKGVRYRPAPLDKTGGLDLCAVLATLAGDGISRLLVEGGPHIARAFLDARLADEIIVMKGAGGASPADAMPPFVDEGLERLEDSPDFILRSQRTSGKDVIYSYRSSKYWRG